MIVKWVIGSIRILNYSLPVSVSFTGVFALQTYKSYGVPAKADRFPLFVAMTAGSVIALGLMRALKPKPKKK